ncbi:hypothetical protein ACIKTA_07595, partial [Hansschlegelia beijingensis]
MSEVQDVSEEFDGASAGPAAGPLLVIDHVARRYRQGDAAVDVLIDASAQLAAPGVGDALQLRVEGDGVPRRNHGDLQPLLAGL